MNGKKHITEVYGVVTSEDVIEDYRRLINELGPAYKDRLLRFATKVSFSNETDVDALEKIHTEASGGESPFEFYRWQIRLSTMQTRKDGVGF